MIAGPDPSESASRLVCLSPEHTDAAVDVLCEAFGAYPVMQYVLGPENREFAAHLRALIRYFVEVRFLRDESVFGIVEAGEVGAAAIVTHPGERPHPPEVSILRRDLWRRLGPDAQARYEAFGDAAGRFQIDTPHYRLNMIGVRASHRGRGWAGRLLDHVHDLSANDPGSTGVTLSTEVAENLSLYEHFGYRLLGHSVVSGDLETWVFFRPDNRSTEAGADPQASGRRP